jgi:hypothetical protein
MVPGMGTSAAVMLQLKSPFMFLANSLGSLDPPPDEYTEGPRKAV